jgi:uncharacterized protein YbaR (Trm112 family)
MELSRELLDILVCPACKEAIVPTADGTGLDCHRCGLRYPVRDGIPVMLVDEAEKIQ